MVEKKLVIIVIIVIVNIITTSIMAILIYIFPQMTLTGLMVMIFARQGNRKSCLVSFIISSISLLSFVFANVFVFVFGTTAVIFHTSDVVLYS